MANPAAAVEAWLAEEWLELRNGASVDQVRYVRGGIDIAHAAGLLTNDGRELWLRRIEACPGHDDEAGRDWCAFCGEMNRAPTGTTRGRDE